MIAALIKRWWYLLTVGMFRGECAVTIRSADGRIRVIGSGRPGTDGRYGVFSPYRIWWERR